MVTRFEDSFALAKPVFWNRSNRLQRLFSTFPRGRPGVGLLLLRVAVALIVIIQGALYFVDGDSLSLSTCAVGLILILAGASFLIGFLTPVAGGLVCIGAVSAACSGSPPPWSLFDALPTTILVVIVAAALTLLGPGAMSVDARLFGRREIIVPRDPKSLRMNAEPP